MMNGSTGALERSGGKIARHAAIYLLARGLPGAIACLAIPLFTRFLQPADYGRYALTLATVSLLNALMFQGLRLSLVRYLPAGAAEALKSTFITFTVLALGVLGLCAALASLLPAARPWRPVLFQGWILLAMSASFELCCEYSRAMIRPWNYMGLQLTRSVGMVGLGIVLVWLGAGWHGPLFGLSGGMAVAVAYSYWKDWRHVRFRIDRALLARICAYGLPLSLTVGLGVLIGTSDRFLIAALLGESAAGLYSVAANLANQTLMLVMIAVYLAVFPHAVRAWEEGGAAAAAVEMRYNILLLMALGLPCVVGMIVLTPGIAHCLLGRSFRQAAAGIIPLVAVGTFLCGLKACHFDAALQLPHRTSHQVWIALVTAVANVAINLVAIRMAGINGAAAGSALAYAIAVGLTVLWGRRYIVLPFPGRAALQVTLASGVMAMLLYPLRDRVSPLALAGQVIGGAAVYGLALLACNFLDFRVRIQRKWFARPVAASAAMELGGSGS